MSHRRVLFAVYAVSTCTAAAQVLTQFDTSGTLAWTNSVNTNALYTIEWAAEAGGPWYRTLQNQQTRDGHSNTAFTVDTPMFYRVVMTTSAPPAGMVWIEAGDFVMGRADTAIPVHTNFTSGFWMDATEVTKTLWDEVYNWAVTNGFEFDNAGQGRTNNHPVHTVNWHDAAKWCNARSFKEGLVAAYRVPDESVEPGAAWYPYKTNQMALVNSWVNWSANGYRLPTEAEWEKAANGGRQGRRFPWGGDTISHAQANYHATNLIAYDVNPTWGHHPDAGTTTPRTLPVGSFAPNHLGLYDMAGNVREWCWDWDNSYSNSYQSDPRGPESGTERINRGGTWDGGAYLSQVAYRLNNDPGFENSTIGFRCVRRP